MKQQRMALPPLFGLVRIVAELSACIGCLVGGVWAIAGIKLIEYNAWAGFMAMLPGVASLSRHSAAWA